MELRKCFPCRIGNDAWRLMQQAPKAATKTDRELIDDLVETMEMISRFGMRWAAACCWTWCSTSTGAEGIFRV